MPHPAVSHEGGKARLQDGTWFDVDKLEEYPAPRPGYQILYMRATPNPRFEPGDRIEISIPGLRPMIQQVTQVYGPNKYRLP